MHPFLIAAIWDIDLLYAVPLIVSMSLIYAATRHERMELIFSHALRMGVWVVGFMAIVFVVVKLISWQV